MAGPTTYFDPARTAELDDRTRSLVERRARVLGASYRLFYERPLELVRGSGTRLWDADGAEYLDAYNNVPSVGHAHPRVAAAIAEQAARLTTHTRYLSEPLIAYSEQLLALFPAAIENVIYTCTGSEANDVALGMAKAVTGGAGVVVTSNAYHGVTTEVAAISPSLGGVSSIAPWVRVVNAPNPYRDGGSTTLFALEVATAFASLAEAGYQPAALIVDTIFSSDGVQPGPLGSLALAVETARASGALFIADEVQPGFGRLGTGLWGFERHSVEPDIVTLGKPMGNGHPVAAVLASSAIMDAFASHARYFSTFGGSSVAIAAAQATLDVLLDEGLVANAAEVGGYLLEGLGELTASHPAVGDVRGIGLFVGVELVGPDRTPDEALALSVVNRLRERRVLLAASGEHNNVLKIRPPLVFSRDDADWLLTELDSALAAG